MKLLIKYPSRNRPYIFLNTLKKYIDKAVDLSKIEFLISIDEDDESMNHEVLDAVFALKADITIHKGKGISKIEACNRDIEKAKSKWDIVVLVSDDMECTADGWDEKIRRDMAKFYPDTDGCLWYHDGAQNFICTLSIIGRKYYDQFNYIYHPSYKSFFCDNEFTEIARNQNKIRSIPQMIVKHQHPSWGGKMQHDELYKKNDRFWSEDETNYHKRKSTGWKN